MKLFSFKKNVCRRYLKPFLAVMLATVMTAPVSLAYEFTTPPPTEAGNNNAGPTMQGDDGAASGPQAMEIPQDSLMPGSPLSQPVSDEPAAAQGPMPGGQGPTAPAPGGEGPSNPAPSNPMTPLPVMHPKPTPSLSGYTLDKKECTVTGNTASCTITTVPQQTPGVMDPNDPSLTLSEESTYDLRINYTWHEADVFGPADWSTTSVSGMRHLTETRTSSDPAIKLTWTDKTRFTVDNFMVETRKETIRDKTLTRFSIMPAPNGNSLSSEVEEKENWIKVFSLNGTVWSKNGTESTKTIEHEATTTGARAERSVATSVIKFNGSDEDRDETGSVFKIVWDLNDDPQRVADGKHHWVQMSTKNTTKLYRPNIGLQYDSESSTLVERVRVGAIPWGGQLFGGEYFINHELIEEKRLGYESLPNSVLTHLTTDYFKKIEGTWQPNAQGTGMNRLMSSVDVVDNGMHNGAFGLKVEYHRKTQYGPTGEPLLLDGKYFDFTTVPPSNKQLHIVWSNSGVFLGASYVDNGVSDTVLPLLITNSQHHTMAFLRSLFSSRESERFGVPPELIWVPMNNVPQPAWYMPF